MSDPARAYGRGFAAGEKAERERTRKVLLGLLLPKDPELSSTAAAIVVCRNEAIGRALVGLGMKREDVAAARRALEDREQEARGGQMTMGGTDGVLGGGHDG